MFGIIIFHEKSVDAISLNSKFPWGHAPRSSRRAIKLFPHPLLHSRSSYITIRNYLWQCSLHASLQQKLFLTVARTLEEKKVGLKILQRISHFEGSMGINYTLQTKTDQNCMVERPGNKATDILYLSVEAKIRVTMCTHPTLTSLLTYPVSDPVAAVGRRGWRRGGLEGKQERVVNCCVEVYTTHVHIRILFQFTYQQLQY